MRKDVHVASTSSELWFNLPKVRGYMYPSIPEKNVDSKNEDIPFHPKDNHDEKGGSSEILDSLSQRWVGDKIQSKNEEIQIQGMFHSIPKINRMKRDAAHNSLIHFAKRGWYRFRRKIEENWGICTILSNNNLDEDGFSRNIILLFTFPMVSDTEYIEKMKKIGYLYHSIQKIIRMRRIKDEMIVAHNSLIHLPKVGDTDSIEKTKRIWVSSQW